MKVNYIDNEYALKFFVELIGSESKIHLDCESSNMHRTGGFSIIQISAGDIMHIIDTVLIDSIEPLKPILESDKIMKIMWDGRTDCDIFLHKYNINVVNVYDLQVAEVLARRLKGVRVRYTLGLVRALGYVLGLENDRYKKILQNKIDAKGLYSEDYKKWDERPISSILLLYSVNDIKYMGEMYDFYRETLYSNGKTDDREIVKISMRRIDERRKLKIEIEQTPDLAIVDF